MKVRVFISLLPLLLIAQTVPAPKTPTSASRPALKPLNQIAAELTSRLPVNSDKELEKLIASIPANLWPTSEEAGDGANLNDLKAAEARAQKSAARTKALREWSGKLVDEKTMTFSGLSSAKEFRKGTNATNNIQFKLATKDKCYVTVALAGGTFQEFELSKPYTVTGKLGKGGITITSHGEYYEVYIGMWSEGAKITPLAPKEKAAGD